MKALVLTGGAGTRLRPFSHSMPKQLVPVANRPVLLTCLDNIRDTGVREVGLVVGDRADAIREAVGDQPGLDITYLQQDAPRGLAHCVLIARDFLGDDDFVMYLGDNVLVGGIADLAERFRQRRPAAQLAVTKVDEPRSYGVAELDADGAVTRLVEKPQNPTSDLAVIGVYFFTPIVHRAVERIRPSQRGELEITDALQWLVSNGYDVRAEIFPRYWKDTGRVEDLLECNRALLETLVARVDGEVDARSELVGPVAVAPGARIVRSRVVGPSVIGPHSVIEDSRLGPYAAVGSGCVLERAGVERSIVLDDVTVRDVHGIHDSVIGRAAEVSRAAGAPPRRRLVIGDHSTVELLA